MENVELLKSTIRGLSYRYSVLKKINNLLAASAGPHEFLDGVLALLTDMFSAEAGAVILKSQDSEMAVEIFRAHMSAGKEKAAKEDIEKLPVKINETGIKKIISENFTPQVEDKPETAGEYRKRIQNHLGKIDSAAAAPVRSNDTTVGVIEIYNFPSFKKDKQESFSSIGVQVGVALEILNRLRGLRQRAKVMRDITSITEAISEPRHLDAVLDIIIRKMLEFFNAEGGSIFLKNSEGDIEFAAVSGKKKKTLEGRKLNTGEGVVGWSMEKDEALLVRNAARDKRFSPRVDKATDMETGSLICVPLKVLNQVTGAVEAVRTSSSFPFNQEDLGLLVIIASHASLAIDKARMYGMKDRWLNSVVNLLTRAIDSKNTLFPGHSAKVRKYAKLIAGEMNINPEDRNCLDIAATVKDIGKLATPDSIMEKKDKLSDEEWAKLRRFPLKSVEILQTIGEFDSVIPIIKYHCENYDGTGYPGQLEGEEIPPLARILALADAFAAMISERPYREALSLSQARDEIINQKGKQFDPEVVEALLRGIENQTHK